MTIFLLQNCTSTRELYVGSGNKKLAHKINNAIKNSDLITCYRMAPHEDALESKKRAVDNLLSRLENGKRKPKYKAWNAEPLNLKKVFIRQR